MAAPQQLEKLVRQFDRNLASYSSGAYNEAQVRTEFIDPMFELLGWDMRNEQGHAEAYKDVIYEDAIQIGGTTKAPDYCFRIGGTRKFFLEAKKPSVSIKNEPSPAYQLRRYAWSAKLPLSLLTDFGELAVYDCRAKPEKSDTPAIARINYLTFDQYPDRWDEIERWRDLLARNIAIRNPRLSIHELNEAVQRTIDRIIFLRICEDRGIETESQWQLRSLENGANVYPRLFQLFERADQRYNSGLFHFQKEKGFAEGPDVLTRGLAIDDKVLKEIIGALYYPESPYEFSVLPADILGQVYEQFLGKVIRLTAGHQAKVEDKPEVKKAGGVYYTPTYIVDYIVEHTVGDLLQGRTPRQAADLRILDPACGSGSFLLGAYQRLLDWHRDWYVADGPEKHTKPRKARQPALYQGAGGEWRLTTAERKRILVNSIFGVDIDAQAVEVTKLSLLLKVLEGESEQEINQNLTLFQERALPDLGSNIRCGNSLIGTDYYQGRQGELFDEEEALRVSAFDWDKAFPAIFQRENPGFDAVIGNPPYIRIQSLPKAEASYLSSRYQSATGNCDVYVSFVERSYHILRQCGVLALILPNKFLRTDYGYGLRAFLSEERAVTRIINFVADQVFTSTIYTCLLFLGKQHNERFEYSVATATPLGLATATLSSHSSRRLGSAPWTLETPRTAALMTRVDAKAVPLLSVPAEMSRGTSTGCDEVFIFPAGALDVEAGILREPLFATDFRRYAFAPSGQWKMIFPYVSEEGEYRLLEEHELRRRFPKAFGYLFAQREALGRRKQFRQWYAFSAPRNLQLHDKAQIAVPLLADRGLCAFFPEALRGRLCPMASGGFTISFPQPVRVKPQYVLGLINSRLLFWRLRSMSNVFRGGWVTCTKQYFGQLPVRVPDPSVAAEMDRHDRMVDLVDRMLALHTKLAAARTDHEKEVLQRRIDATDREIDALVYELYGLTDDEIKIVEEAAP